MVKRRTPQIILNLPPNVAQLILFGRHVVTSVKGSQKLQSVVPAADKLSTDLDTLETSEAHAKKGGQGAVDQRNADLEAVRTDFEVVRVGVLAVAAADPANAEVIIDSSGLSMKRKVGHKKGLAEVAFPAPGQAHVKVKAVKRGASYEWQISGDGGKTFVPAGTTTIADQIFTGLTAGTTYEVRWRTTVRRTTSDWSQTFAFMMR
jgi:hypothetical protein